MVSDLEASEIIIIATVLISSYAAYWAFDIRRALAVRLYRSQALGIGLVSLSFAYLYSYLYVQNAAPNLVSSLPSLEGDLIVFLSFTPFLLTFYWTDSSVMAARRSDPLLREILGWRRVRLVLWPLVVIGFVAVQIPYTQYAALTSSLLSVTPLLLSVFIPLGCAAVYLPMSAFRSKDPTLRRHLLWFGIFAASILTTAIFFNIVQSFAATISLAISLVTSVFGGYCLYRSARSLVPLNRISSD